MKQTFDGPLNNFDYENNNDKNILIDENLDEEFDHDDDLLNDYICEDDFISFNETDAL